MQLTVTDLIESDPVIVPEFDACLSTQKIVVKINTSGLCNIYNT